MLDLASRVSRVRVPLDVSFCVDVRVGQGGRLKFAWHTPRGFKSHFTHTVLFRTIRSGSTLCIVASRRLVRLKGGASMELRLEEEPLKGICCFDASLGIGDISLLLEFLTSILLCFDDNRLHLKM